MSSPSLNGCLYYVIFIDDYSRKCWIYFLKVKSDTFDKFKEYKAFIEKQTGKHIRTLRTDNGGEFESLQFEDFCKEAGIKRQLTVPYNPQQNGVAERKNRTICEAVKAMMFDLGSAKFFMGRSYLHCRVYLEQVSTCYLEGQDS
jgi:transposase InsO family protein